MSASRSSRSSRSSRRSKKKTSSSPSDKRTVSNSDGIDYGPARAAISDLAIWAFDLAERDVEDWPVAQKRVKNVRRSILAELANKRARRASIEDLVFTASLIARILDEDLGVDVADALAVLDYLDLPADDVQLTRPPARRAPSALAVRPTRIPTPASRSITPTVRLRTPPPLRFCDDCGYVHEPGDHIGYRNAA